MLVAVGAHGATTNARWRRLPRLRVLLHAGRDPRERVGGARAGRASIRARACGLSDGRARGAARRGARAGAAGARRRRAACASTTGCSGAQEGVVDDFVVRRNDGAFAYNLAVVVDDAAQGIEEVVRGADLLDSTPRQIWLARALGAAPQPSYAHVPLVLGADGRRLAKRHGDVTLREVEPADARCLDGVRRSGLRAASTPRPICSTASTRDELPREPTTYRA